MPLVSRLALAIVLGLSAGLASCGDDDAGTDTASGEPFPDVLEVTAEPTGERTYSFAVTISSPYDSPDRYADGWRILTPDGEQIAEHELLHDHADEQPFTREQSGVEVPPGVSEVVVEPRDSENGYGGGRRTVALPVQPG